MQTPLQILKKYWGYEAFRYPQEEIINSVLHKHDTIALMPTGGGKSLTFQVPAMLQEGICLVISPLIALMTDQVNALNQRNIKALSLVGNLSLPDLERLLGNALYGQYKFLYMSPERLQHHTVQQFLKNLPLNLIVIDEAHCVSHWGKDFRPAYLQCGSLKTDFPQVPLLALTASATPKVQQDIRQLLNIPNAKVISTTLQRPNIAYNVYQSNDKLPLLFSFLRKNEGSVIIYLRSRNGTSYLSSILNTEGFTATFFHGGLTTEEKEKRLQLWLQNKVRIMVATNAFGMGIDKPDVRLVVHWNLPSTLEDYFQEAGRAGRDGKPAKAVLIYNPNDLATAKKLLDDYLIDISFLKHLYKKLNSYFQIAIGQGAGQTYSFLFPEFCKRYQLPTLKAYNALLVLDRFSVIHLNQQFHNKVTLQLNDAKLLMNYIHTHRHLSALLFYLARTYPLIYTQPVVIETAKITERTDLEHYQLLDYLQQLHRDGMGTLKNEQADIELTFCVIRDDDRTINYISKNVKEYNRTKLTLQEQVYKYLADQNTCRSVQLLHYFGETNVQPCGICSNCEAKKAPPKIDEQQLRNDLWQLLLQKPITPYEVLQQLPYPQKAIHTILREWLTMNKIIFNECNEIIVK